MITPKLSSKNLRLKAPADAICAIVITLPRDATRVRLGIQTRRFGFVGYVDFVATGPGVFVWQAPRRPLHLCPDDDFLISADAVIKSLAFRAVFVDAPLRRLDTEFADQGFGHHLHDAFSWTSHCADSIMSISSRYTSESFEPSQTDVHLHFQTPLQTHGIKRIFVKTSILANLQMAPVICIGSTILYLHIERIFGDCILWEADFNHKGLLDPNPQSNFVISSFEDCIQKIDIVMTDQPSSFPIRIDTGTHAIRQTPEGLSSSIKLEGPSALALVLAIKDGTVYSPICSWSDFVYANATAVVFNIVNGFNDEEKRMLETKVLGCSRLFVLAEDTKRWQIESV